LSRYSVELISLDERDSLMDRYADRVLYEVRADIYGCCIKLLTDQKYVKERWEESFYPMGQSVRSHGRLVVVKDPELGMRVLYEPVTKTAFLINVDYYGWVKSIALSVAGDIMEDAHDIYSVHGACLDVCGRGVCLIAPSGTGKTTHTYGLLRSGGVRVVADDWFFVRIFGEDVLAFGSEKNFYIRADIAKIWGEYERLVEGAEFDPAGRAVVNVRWIVGKGRVIPMTTMRLAILLKRDPEDPEVVRRLMPEEALEWLVERGFCNPHLLVRSDYKLRKRVEFFREFLKRVKTYLVNTVRPPRETNNLIRDIVGI